MTTTDYTDIMSKRVASLLMPGEAVLHAASRHWLSYTKPIVLGLVALACLYQIAVISGPDIPQSWLLSGTRPTGNNADGLDQLMWEMVFCGAALFASLIGLLVFINNWTLIMIATNRRVIMRVGLIARESVDIPLSKIDVVMVEQGLIARIFGSGNVVVRTVGEATTVFAQISHPALMRNAVVTALENRNTQPAEK